MRLIFSFLALAQIRLALADYARAEMLERHADEAIARARTRVVVADTFGQRAGLRHRLMPLR